MTGKAEKPVWTRKHLLTLEELSPAEIVHVLDTAEGFTALYENRLESQVVTIGARIRF